MAFRLVLLLAIAAVLAIFITSNLQPLTLVFLGIKTPALPLSVWVVGAIAAGIITNLTINLLLGLATTVTNRERRSQFRQTPRRSRFQDLRQPRYEPEPVSRATRATPTSVPQDIESEDDATWSNWEGYETARDHPSPVTEPVDSAAATPWDDWEAGSSDDWETLSPQDRPRTTEPAASAQPAAAIGAPRQTIFEKPQAPQTASRTGSIYSYSYREPEKSGAGHPEPVHTPTQPPDQPRPPADVKTSVPAQRERVVDVDYRVLIPPYHPPEELVAREEDEAAVEAEESADDWFEEINEDFDAQGRRR